MAVLAPQGEDIDRGLGEFIEQFEKPIYVGEMSHLESLEIRARNKIIARMSEDMDHLAKTRALVTNEKISFIRGIGARVGLGPRDELSVDDESGAITHVAVRRFVQPEPEVVETPEVAPDPVLEDIAPAN